MNSSQISQTQFGPQLGHEPRLTGPNQLLSYALWLPALTATVALSLHRVFSCKPDGSGLKIIAFVSLFIILIRVGRRSDIWEKQP